MKYVKHNTALSLLVLCAALCQVSAVVVNTQYGPVRGRETSVDNGEIVSTVHEFRGIPFGKDTSGPRRFANPEPVDPWTETFEAFTPGDSCPQRLFFILSGFVPGWDHISEDCLNLDIYTPDAHAAPGTYPVMVWMYGGAYQQGANIQYPGHFLAQNDVVVVVLNYRLGKFGYAYTGNAAAPGNAGLWDQKLGLEFVRDNIANFGGNPDMVTVFGESAGAGSTALLMLSPLSKDLFHQAILESGAETNVWVMNRPESNPEDYIHQVAEHLDCSNEDDFAMIDCLRGKSMDDLIYNSSSRCTTGFLCLGMSPVVDGPGGMVPKTPEELRAEGDIMSGPIISGIMRDDGSIFVPLAVPEAVLGCCNRTYFQRVLRDRIMRVWAPRFDNETFEDAFQAVDWNYSEWPHIYDNENNRQSFVRIFTDGLFMHAWDRQLKEHSSLATTRGFVFDYRSDNSSTAEWMGVGHAAELAYVWGYPMLQLNEHIRNDSYLSESYFNDVDRAYSRYIQKLWANFAKYGDPTFEPVESPVGGVTTWPAFDDEDLAVMYLGKDETTVVKEYEQRNVAFWQEYMDYILYGTSPETSTDWADPSVLPSELTTLMLGALTNGASEEMVDELASLMVEMYED